MKILKKLNLVSFKLDKLLANSGISISDEISKELKNINKELPTPKEKKTFKNIKFKKLKMKKDKKENVEA